MSKLKIRLVKGEDFENDMPTAAQVTIHNHGAYCHHRPAGRVAARYVKEPEKHHRPSGERLHLLGNHRATAHQWMPLIGW